MYKIMDDNGDIYTLYQYEKEADYERMIVKYSSVIFGSDGIYFDVKKLIGKPKKGGAIPDGYYLDLTFHTDPKLYLVEVELSSHDIYGHIGEQILRFGISSETDKYRVKRILLESLEEDSPKKEKLQTYFSGSQYGNVNELLDKVIFDDAPAAIIVIDKATEELEHVMAQLTMSTDVIEAQTYVCGKKQLHCFRPFKDDVLSDLPVAEDADELDTVVVPAHEDGFREEFLANGCWYAIRISGPMIGKIKYAAAYQVAPVSGITCIAEVDRIEKYQDTNKYILYFKPGTVKKIEKVGLGKNKGQAPQAPRYTSLEMIRKAKTLDDIWG